MVAQDAILVTALAFYKFQLNTVCLLSSIAQVFHFMDLNWTLTYFCYAFLLGFTPYVWRLSLRSCVMNNSDNKLLKWSLV